MITRLTIRVRRIVGASLPTFVLLYSAEVGRAGNTTASLTLSGTVTRVVSVRVASLNNYNSLNLVSGENGKVVGQISEFSNDGAGYTVTVSSAGARAGSQAMLRSSSPSNPEMVPYLLTYGGVPVQFNQGQGTVHSTAARTAGAGTRCDVAVTIPAMPGLAMDTYSDTLTFTIQGK